jgi:hypothetical protein
MYALTMNTHAGKIKITQEACVTMSSRMIAAT